VSSGNGAVLETSLYGFKFRDVDRRRNPERKTYDIKQLWQRSHEILNLALLGYKGRKISKLLNISEVTVSNTLNSTLGMEKISGDRKNRDEEYEKLHDEVMELTKKSLRTYNEILDDTSESRKLKKDTADTVVLELSGLRVPTKIHSSSISAQLSADELEAIKKRGIEAARDAGMIVDVEK